MKLVLSALIIAACGSAQADLLFGKSTLVFPAGPGVPKAGNSLAPDITPDGQYISFITNRMDVRANDDANSYDVARADVVGNVVKVVNRLADGTYYVPNLEGTTYISDRGQFIAFNSDQEFRPNGTPIGRFAANRANLEQKTIDSIIGPVITGFSLDGNTLFYQGAYGRTFNPPATFDFLAGHQGSSQSFESAYSNDGNVRLAFTKFGEPTITGIQAVTRSRRFWLLEAGSLGEYYTPVWVSNDPGPNEPLVAHFITNQRISPFDFDFLPDLYTVNTATAERQFIQLTGTSVKAVSASRNGRYTVVQYSDGMADIITMPSSTGPFTPTRQLNVSNLRQISKHITDDGRYIAAITTDGRLVRHDLETNISVEAGIGTNPAPPRATLRSYSNSSSGNIISFNAPDNFISGQTAGAFIKDTVSGVTRKLNKDYTVGPVSDTGRAYIFTIGANTYFRNEDRTLTVRIPAYRTAEVSGDGLFVNYQVEVNGRVQNYVYDVVAGRTRLVSRNLQGKPTTGFIRQVRVSGNGRLVAFTSDAPDLFNGPAMNRLYIYDVVADRLTSPNFPIRLTTDCVVLGVSFDGTRVIIRSEFNEDSIWRYYVPRNAFTKLLPNFFVYRDAQVSPSGNLIFNTDEFGNSLTRISDRRTETFSRDVFLTLLPGDQRARVSTNGVLADVNFAFTDTP